MKNLKRNSLLILLVCLTVTLMVALSSCNVGGAEETPTGCQHELTAVSEVKATCAENGTEGYYTCFGCDKFFADAEGSVEIEAPKSTEKLGHSFTNYASNNDATCVADGTKTAKCDRCDVTSIVIEEGTKKAHSFTTYESDNNATYTQDGTKTAKCDNCTAEDTITDIDSKYTLFHEEYMAQVASYGSTNGPTSDKRMKISFSIPMQAGTKITFLGNTEVYMYTVIRTNNPDDTTAEGAYAVDPGWLEDSVFVMPEPDEGNDAEYPVLIVRRVDNAKITADELMSLHTMFTVEGKRAVATDVSGTLTDEEYNRQFAHWGSVPGPVQTTRQRISFAIKMNIGTVIEFIGDSAVYRWAVVETFNTAVTSGTLDSGWNNKWTDPTADYVTKLNGSYPVITICRVDGVALTTEEIAKIHSMFKVSGSKYSEETAAVEVKDYPVLSINHRGYNYKAPENTLSAYRLSYLAGFRYVECDVAFTKDGYAVLLHDDTIDRTSNGTGKVSDYTLAELRELDFGSWKSPEYAGEKIPTFEEFILLCKELGLHPYIEIKGSVTEAQAEYLVNIVKENGLLDDCSWICFYMDSLVQILKYDSTARVGFLARSITESIINSTLALDNGTNKVFLNVKSTAVNTETARLCEKAKLPLEVWSVNNENEIINIHPYVSGVTSDYIVSGAMLAEKEIENSGHSFKNWTVSVSPTYSSIGWMHTYCAYCRSKNTVMMPVVSEANGYTKVTLNNFYSIWNYTTSDGEVLTVTIQDVEFDTYEFTMADNDPFIAENGGSFIAGTTEGQTTVKSSGNYGTFYEVTKGATFTMTVNVEEDTTVNFIIKVCSTNGWSFSYTDAYTAVTVNGESVKLNEGTVSTNGWSTSTASAVRIATLNLKAGEPNVITFTVGTETAKSLNIASIVFESAVPVTLGANE